MDTETLEALEGSIAKWRGIVAATVMNEGAQNCPLCQKFNRTVNVLALPGCQDCPVKMKTGLAGCGGTPYEDYEEAGDDEVEQAKAARAELAFLESLRPGGR